MSKIRESAQGEDCTIRYARVCNFNRETVVWAHANGSAAGKGIGMKANDLLGAYACSACHDLYDRRTSLPEHLTRADVVIGFWEGHARSILRLIERGIIIVHRGKTLVAA